MVLTSALVNLSNRSFPASVYISTDSLSIDIAPRIPHICDIHSTVGFNIIHKNKALQSY